MKLFSIFAAFALFSTQAYGIYFDFTGGTSPVDGATGNIRTFSAGGVTVNVSGWSRDIGGVWRSEYSGHFADGLGVSNSGPVDSTERLDNTPFRTGWDEFLLFEFSTAVVPDQIALNSVLLDSDFTLWLSDVTPDPFTNHLNLNSDSTFIDLFAPSLESSLIDNAGQDRVASVNAGGAAGNAMVINPIYLVDNPSELFNYSGNDSFLIGGVNLEIAGGGTVDPPQPNPVPESGTTGVALLMALAPLLVGRRFLRTRRADRD